MKAIVKPGPQKGVEIRDIKTPVPGPEEILIDVQAAAICGTDIHYYEWNQAAVDFSSKFGVKFPFVLGHEVCGTIREVGSGGQEREGRPEGRHRNAHPLRQLLPLSYRQRP